ncbi:hypothetical protein [Photobacterium atrarenae]|uniref:Uncharacterized protein n=1 Tax=Photobacterium atrarenae TaxID=865757 RepID=A0ABY5GNX5_9GAMM|nr:hypothetical protein [Photobacterium atrarenae]UTV30252.1 hypothetical protein NNL38_16870 [Photobacterium atrarenae]
MFKNKKGPVAINRPLDLVIQENDVSNFGYKKAGDEASSPAIARSFHQIQSVLRFSRITASDEDSVIPIKVSQ